MEYLTPQIIIENNLSDYQVRKLIKIGCKHLLTNLEAEYNNNAKSYKQTFINTLKQSPIAVEEDKANQQHYEVDSLFYNLVLGDHKTYSCCYWNEHIKKLSEAESAVLNLICQRADIK